MAGKFLSPHTGVDIAAPDGNIVRTTASGIVALVDFDQQLGLFVQIDHLNGYTTKYGHLNNAVVSPGDWVERDDRIGIVGETGHARGPHVHYELAKDKAPIDPLKKDIENKRKVENG